MNTSKIRKISVVSGLLMGFFAWNPVAQAEWVSDDITSIIDNVKAVKREVIGSDGKLKRVTDDFKAQLEEMVEKGWIVRESVEEILGWLQSREGPYREFAGAAGCSGSSPCAIFRSDMDSFFERTAALRDNFPIFERLGFGDGSRAREIVNSVPPIMLFGLYVPMKHNDHWKSLPDELQALYDEIGDPDVFSLDSMIPSSNTAAAGQLQAVSYAGVFQRTATQRFCDNQAWALERQIDAVRMNRLKFMVFYIRQGLGLVESLTSETIGITLVGEGNETLVPNPLKLQLKLILLAFDVIEKAVGTYQANLGICRTKNREYELLLAQCLPLVDVVKPGSRDEIYQLAGNKIDSAREDGLDVGLSQYWLDTAGLQRTDGEYRDAFESLCTAYQTIGSSCSGNCTPNNGGGGRSKP